MKTLTYLLLATACLLLYSCDMLVSKPDSVSGLNVTDALYLGVEDISSIEEDASSNLVKIMDGEAMGDAIEVEFTDGEGNFLGNNVVYADVWTIHPASEEYTIIAGEFKFNIHGGEQRHFGLVLNNRTGAIYGLEDYYYPEPLYGLQGEYYYQTDGDGNIYFVKSGLYRILVQDSTNLQLEYYIDKAAGIFDQRYLVDKSGNVYFQEGGRVKKHSGGIEETGMKFVAFNGTDGNCYGFQQNWTSVAEETEQPNVNTLKLEVIDGAFKTTVVNDNGFYFEAGVASSLQYFDYENNRSIFIAYGYFNQPINTDKQWPIGFIFKEDSYDIIPLVVNDERYFEFMGISGDYLWIRVDANHYEAWNLSSATEGNTVATIEEIKVFEIPGEFKVSSARLIQCGNGISFKAFKLDTETTYAGKISVENGLEYSETDSEAKVTSLTRIN